MIYLNLTGGLGNQMFQYAYLYMFEKKYNDNNVIVNISSYKTDRLRDFSLIHFNINPEWKYVDAEKEINERFKVRLLIYKALNRMFVNADKAKDNYEKMTPSYKIKYTMLEKLGIYRHYYSRYTIPRKSLFKSKYISGMWHAHKLFDQYLDELKKTFTLNEPLDEKNTVVQEKISTENSVCVHIRRGDYLKYPKYAVCDKDYYTKAIDMAIKDLGDPKFFFFSDDIKWVKDNFGDIQGATFIENNNPDYLDFALMSSAKHFIISNSTFSWWAAICGSCEKKKVYLPNKWYADSETKECMYYPNWVRI